MRNTFGANFNQLLIALAACILPVAATAQVVPVRAPDNHIRGVLITSVISNSTASKAGLQAGCIVTRVNNERVTSLSEFVEKLGAANGAARLTMFDRTTKQFRTADVQPDARGMIGVYAIATDRIAAYRTSVLLVNGVNPGSPAALAGLMPGDVILMVNGARVPTAADFVTLFQLSGPIASITYVSGFDGSLRVATLPADPLGRIGAFFVPVPWR